MREKQLLCSACCLGDLPYKPCASEHMPCCPQRHFEGLPPAGARRGLCLASFLHRCSAELITFLEEAAAWSGCDLHGSRYNFNVDCCRSNRSLAPATPLQWI